MTTDNIIRGSLLRIISTGEIISVEQITRRKFGYFPGGNKQGTMRYVRSHDCEPIPITEEWLLSHGFTHDEKDESLFRSSGDPEFTNYQSFVSANGQVTIRNISNTPPPYDWSVHVDNDYFESVASADIAYVHELQMTAPHSEWSHYI